MREFKVHGDGAGPRFRDQGKKWYDGNIITEAELLGIYRLDHIASLVESGALEAVTDLVLHPVEVEAIGVAPGPGDVGPEATGIQALAAETAPQAGVSGEEVTAAPAAKSRGTKGRK